MDQTDLGREQGDSDRGDPNSSKGQVEHTMVTLGQIEQNQGQHWTRRNRPKIKLGPDGKDSGSGPDQTDPRPTLGQTEQTQDQHWDRPKRLRK